MELFMKYFSIDYRSPPSGLGQIIEDLEIETILDRSGNEVWNCTLITYSGCGSENDPNYIRTKHFSSQAAEEEGWAGPVMEEIFQFLRDQGVTLVSDSELSYNVEGADDFGRFTLDRWIEIMRSFL